ncbi:MAG: NADPH:quinone oxidoreductase family protein [Acidimicrobiaceae bacterium]|nr:NADPH:quinone oxidoreductase family protein [Acidimicrobiaceae bacterium]
MKALRCNEYGPPESLVVEEIDDPEAGEDEVVVAVEAAAVNFPDVLIAANEYQVPVPAPFTPGSEFAGRVLSVGKGVTSVRPGDAVSGSCFVGAFAEQVAVRASSLRPVPDGVSFPEAAAFHVVYATAYHALRSVGEVAPGDWVVVLGAAGGVGLAAVDVACLLGAKVLAAASSPAKLQACAERGATALVDYSREDLKQRIRDLTGGGADVIIDPVGGAHSEAALRAGKWGCRFVTVGFASGEIPRIPLNLVLLKGVVVKGFEIRTFSQYAPEAAARDLAELAELYRSGKLRPHVSATYPLAGAAQALSAVAGRQAIGKVVIAPHAS